eukprot:gene776-962_t
MEKSEMVVLEVEADDYKVFENPFFQSWQPTSSSTTTTTTTTTTIEDITFEFEGKEIGILESVERIEQTFTFLLDVIESIQASFDEGDVWRNDPENDQFLIQCFNDFQHSKLLLQSINSKLKGKLKNIERLIEESNNLESKYDSLKDTLTFYKEKNETFVKQNNNNSNNNSSSSSSSSSLNINNNERQNSKLNLKKFIKSISTKFLSSSNINNQQFQQQQQQEEQEIEVEEEIETIQDYEILTVTEPGSCPICIEDNIECHNLFIISQCKHQYCISCLSEYLKSNISDRKLVIPCPTPNCKSIFQYEQIKLIVDNETFSKFEEFTLTSFIVADPNFKWCPKPGCGNAVFGEKSNPRTRCSNATCNFEFCFNCEEEWHPNSTCEQYQNWKLENNMVDQKYVVWTKKNHTKKCPKCKSIIEKNAGCNHIHCHCGYNFCWLCNGKYTGNHYDPLNIFGCPGMGRSRIGFGKRISLKSAVGIGVVLGGVLVISLGIPTLVVGLPIYGGYLAQKRIRVNIKRKKQKSYLSK